MKEKILIIEDDPLIRNELKTLLQSNSYKTVAPEEGVSQSLCKPPN